MREAEAALHVLAEEAEGGEGGEEKVGDGLWVVGVGFMGLRQVGEEGGDGLQAQLAAGHLGRGRVVEELDGVVEAADRRREPEVFGRVGGEGGVVEDGRRVDGGVHDAGFDAVGLRVAGPCCAFGCAQRRGDRYTIWLGMVSHVWCRVYGLRRGFEGAEDWRVFRPYVKRSWRHDIEQPAIKVTEYK